MRLDEVGGYARLLSLGLGLGWISGLGWSVRLGVWLGEVGLLVWLVCIGLPWDASEKKSSKAAKRTGTDITLP